MKTKFPLLIISLFLFGCLPNSNLWGDSLNSTATPIPVYTAIPTATQTPPQPATVVSTFTTPRPVSARVLIVSFDGLRPDAISLAPMPNVLALMRSGAYTLTAQTILPSSTLPSHTSMLSGLCVAKHHVTWNDYIPVNGYARGTDLFDLAHAAGLRTVMIVGKEKLRQITEPASTDVFEFIESGENDILARARLEVQNGFGVMFVHFPNGDFAGHKFGWLSKEQLSAYREGDAALGQLLDGLDDGTLVIVTADHGGHNKTHGTDAPEDMTIPWIISGAGIRAMQLTTRVYTMDTAATAAYALGLSIPAEWDGRPITEAFGLTMIPRLEAACR